MYCTRHGIEFTCSILLYEAAFPLAITSIMLQFFVHDLIPWTRLWTWFQRLWNVKKIHLFVRFVFIYTTIYFDEYCDAGQEFSGRGLFQWNALDGSSTIWNEAGQIRETGVRLRLHRVKLRLHRVKLWLHRVKLRLHVH